MSEETTKREPDSRTLADLSALADGTLDPGRVDHLRELIAGSPELGARYDRERRAVLALQSLRDDQAPAKLRFGIETRRQRGPGRRWRIAYGGALATSAALAALLLVLLLPGGTPGSPSVSQAAALALRGPAMPAPASVPGGTLQVGVGKISFPDWGWLGWRPSGQRTDRLDGKLAVTVYYEWHGKRQLAYTILASPPLRQPRAGILHVNGYSVQSFTSRGRVVVTWRLAGQTCVLSALGVDRSDLANLAAAEISHGG